MGDGIKIIKKLHLLVEFLFCSDGDWGKWVIELLIDY